MKILHVCRQFYPCIGGVENFVFCLAREQIKQGNVVSVLTLNRSFCDDARFSSEETYVGVSIKRISFFGSRRYPIALASIKFLEGYDIVHIHCVDFFVDYLAFLKFLHRKKLVLHTHGGFFHTKKYRIFKKIYFNTVTKCSLSGCDKIIACSKNDYDLFRKISSNVVRIDNGVEIRKFSAIAKDVKRNTLLYVGRVDEHKRIDSLIRIIAALKKRSLNTTLRISGPDHAGLVSSLKLLARQLKIEDDVVFLGKVPEDDLLNELSRAHLFVSASEYEAFGISAVEAIASRTLCVLSDIEAFNNIIESGKSGFITDYNNTENATACLIRALSLGPEEYAGMTAEAVEGIEKYSWDRVAQEIVRVYSDIITGTLDKTFDRISMFGISIDNISFNDALNVIADGVIGNKPILIVTPNVHHLIILQKDDEFRKVYKESYLSLPDGMPLLWAAKFLGTPLKEKISGSDLFPRLCGLAAERGYKLFFLGGREGAAVKAAEVLRNKSPAIKIVGCYSPPMGFENDPEENDKIVRMIKDAKPDILFVGLGAPKQEKWIYRHKGEYQVPVSIGVGASFEFTSGMIRRAPRWMQKCGLEWFWRLMMEPKRLWKRYLINDMRFFWLVARQKICKNR